MITAGHFETGVSDSMCKASAGVPGRDLRTGAPVVSANRNCWPSLWVTHYWQSVLNAIGLDADIHFFRRCRK